MAMPGESLAVRRNALEDGSVCPPRSGTGQEGEASLARRHKRDGITLLSEKKEGGKGTFRDPQPPFERTTGQN
jgi:hypothetical protein